MLVFKNRKKREKEKDFILIYYSFIQIVQIFEFSFSELTKVNFVEVVLSKLRVIVYIEGECDSKYNWV